MLGIDFWFPFLRRAWLCGLCGSTISSVFGFANLCGLCGSTISSVFGFANLCVFAVLPLSTVLGFANLCVLCGLLFQRLAFSAVCLALQFNPSH
jgi:biotin transporter BioY